ncbi:CrcB family protein [Streptomyces sp. NPDC088745]|uniref:FluC/FEX family fluoride channel n=1 Tax=Streptomyces sp. NPDC088745 TaxID=3365884 RepID=UPI003828EBFA
MSEPSARAVLAAVSLGGALGAGARYAVLLVWPVPAAGFPWAVFGINVLGSGLIGVLMARAEEGGLPPLVRPFLGVGVLGGFTSFSTYAMDLGGLLEHGELLTAAAYALGTLAGALGAVAAAAALTRRVRRGRTA